MRLNDAADQRAHVALERTRLVYASYVPYILPASHSNLACDHHRACFTDLAKGMFRQVCKCTPSDAPRAPPRAAPFTMRFTSGSLKGDCMQPRRQSTRGTPAGRGPLDEESEAVYAVVSTASPVAHTKVD